jgi:hypothetical protein
MAERILRLALWLAMIRWTGRALLVALALIVFLMSGLFVAGLARGDSPGRALLTAFIATVIIVTMPFRWIARGELPSVDL